jgi:hypothetical protein
MYVDSNEFSNWYYIIKAFEAHPASCPMGTRGPFHGGKARPGCDADQSPRLVPRSRMSRSYIFSPT